MNKHWIWLKRHSKYIFKIAYFSVAIIITSLFISKLLNLHIGIVMAINFILSLFCYIMIKKKILRSIYYYIRRKRCEMSNKRLKKLENTRFNKDSRKELKQLGSDVKSKNSRGSSRLVRAGKSFDVIKDVNIDERNNSQDEFVDNLYAYNSNDNSKPKWRSLYNNKATKTVKENVEPSSVVEEDTIKNNVDIKYENDIDIIDESLETSIDQDVSNSNAYKSKAEENKNYEEIFLDPIIPESINSSLTDELIKRVDSVLKKDKNKKRRPRAIVNEYKCDSFTEEEEVKVDSEILDKIFQDRTEPDFAPRFKNTIAKQSSKLNSNSNKKSGHLKEMFNNDDYIVDTYFHDDNYENNHHDDNYENSNLNDSSNDFIENEDIDEAFLKDGITEEVEVIEDTSIDYVDDSSKINTITRMIEYDIPTDILKPIKKYVNEDIDNSIKNNGEKLIDTLESFGVGAKIINVSNGPSITRYELQPDPGIKVSRIVRLADDIALNLASTGVRIEAPIPGKAAVGIEVPNKETRTVYLKEIIDTDEFKQHKSKLAFAVGMDVSGNVIVGDIEKMPHMLIAGATGSGKSVCINTLIMSILFKSSPDEVKLIMIDPKVVELSIYNGIPHLLIPVVTDPKKAAGALSWAVNEMENRYKLFAQNNVRDIRTYNKTMKKHKSDLMPQIVIIIDELADLMMVASNDVEDYICRLAQKARAAGIHLVVATQRPSVDVITGLIKANIPSRIAFAVSSQVDSRTILDMVGAEKLLGRGDMLFFPMGQSKPTRVQGAFVTDAEIENMVDYLKESYGTAEYNDDVIAQIEQKADMKSNSSTNNSSTANSDDELLNDAVDIILEHKQASISFLQRKLKIGYSRAARIIDSMEEMGIVSASEGSKPRDILITSDEWDLYKQENAE